MGTGKPSTHPLFSGEVPDSPENEQILTPGVQHFKGQSSFLGPGTLFYTNRNKPFPKEVGPTVKDGCLEFYEILTTSHKYALLLSKLLI